jgi:hypothetical protein
VTGRGRRKAERHQVTVAPLDAPESQPRPRQVCAQETGQVLEDIGLEQGAAHRLVRIRCELRHRRQVRGQPRIGDEELGRFQEPGGAALEVRGEARDHERGLEEPKVAAGTLS